MTSSGRPSTTSSTARRGGAWLCSSPGGVLRALRLCVPALRRRGWSLCPRLAACFLVGADFGVSVGYVLSFDFLRAFYHELYYARVGRLSVLLNLAVGSVLFGSVLSLFDAVVDHCLFGSLLATWLTPTSVSPGTTCCPSKLSGNLLPRALLHGGVWRLAVLLHLWCAPCSSALCSSSTTLCLVTAL